MNFLETKKYYLREFMKMNLLRGALLTALVSSAMTAMAGGPVPSCKIAKEEVLTTANLQLDSHQPVSYRAVLQYVKCNHGGGEYAQLKILSDEISDTLLDDAEGRMDRNIYAEVFRPDTIGNRRLEVTGSFYQVTMNGPIFLHIHLGRVEIKLGETFEQAKEKLQGKYEVHFVGRLVKTHKMRFEVP